MQNLPLRAAKTFLSVSVEKLDVGSRAYNMACELWQKKIPLILPNLLLFIRRVEFYSFMYDSYIDF